MGEAIERMMIDNKIKANQEYFDNNPKSSIILFERELKEYVALNLRFRVKFMDICPNIEK